MSFTEFLALVKVVKMLYGRTVASGLFEKNIDKFYDLNYANDSVSIPSTKKVETTV